MFRCMWSEPKKTDEMDIWIAALNQASFDARKFSELIQSSTVKDQLMANTTRSAERGTFGSPTFFVVDEIYFGEDRLNEVEEAIRRTR